MLIHATTCMEIEKNYAKWKKSRHKRLYVISSTTVPHYLYEMSRISKFSETKSGLIVVSRDWGGGGEGKMGS